jgi:hypothetical protein
MPQDDYDLRTSSILWIRVAEGLTYSRYQILELLKSVLEVSTNPWFTLLPRLQLLE